MDLKKIFNTIVNFFSRIKIEQKNTNIAPTPQQPQQQPSLKSTPENPIFSELAEVVKLDDEQFKITYLKDVCAQINKSKPRYVQVQLNTKVPWDLIAAIHFKESSLNFQTMLHNGEPLNIKSRIVPVGVGPFTSWEQAAMDALKRQQCLSISNWTFAQQLAFAESYNGKGYRKHGLYSPYVFSFTNLSQEKGGFPKDHVWDSEYPYKRPGVAAILLYLRSMDSNLKDVTPVNESKTENEADQYPWIIEGLKGIGQKEVSGNSDNQYIVELYKDVVGKPYHDETAWCMAWVMAMLKRVGFKYLISLWAKDAENYGTPCELKPGCIATKYSEAANSKRHVFFVYKVNKEKGTVTALGGNQNNRVMFEEYKISEIMSTRWPVK